MTPTRQLKIAIAIMVANALVAVVGYVITGASVVDAVYMVIVTIFSVGYEEMVPVDTPGMKLFTAGFIIAGCTSLIYFTGALVQFLTEGQILRAMGIRRMTREISHLKNHVIICGFGRIGRVLATELEGAGRDFVIIEHKDSRAKEASDLNFLVIKGDATDENTLKEAGIEKATSLATVLPDDAMNVFITLTAKNLNEAIIVIARGEIPSTEKKLRQAGADRVVLPAHIGAERIAHLLIHPTAAQFVEDESLSHNFRQELREIGMRLREIPVGDDAKYVGKRIRDCEVCGFGGFLVAALRRSNGESIGNPSPNTVIEKGDRLVVICHVG